MRIHIFPILNMLVLQSGQVPLTQSSVAILPATGLTICFFALHLTQYPSVIAVASDLVVPSP